MEINYWAVLGCAMVSMVTGAIWYGPIFGKKWMEILGIDPTDKKAVADMQKSAGPLYGIQLALTLLQVWFLARFIDDSGVITAVLIWLAFIMPTLAQVSLWGSQSKQLAWSRFLIQSGYQLVNFSIYGWILGLYH